MIEGIVYSMIAALGDVLGGALVTFRRTVSRAWLGVLVGFGAGFMLAVALLAMVPAAMDARGGALAVLIGYLLVHLTQHSLTPHFHYGEETHEEAMVSRGIGVWALVGLLPHSFFDGVAIASGFLGGQSLGVLVFTAVLLHKIPTGVSLASVMRASGNSRGRTMVAVLLIALATVLGGAITPAVGMLADYGLALAAGVTIYVAASNLIPESQHERDWRIQGGVFVGVIAYWLTSVAVGH